MRRVLAALTTATALVAVTAAVAPAASAAPAAWPAEDGRLLVSRDDGLVFNLNADGTGFSNGGFGRQPAWSPDGSRRAVLDPGTNRIVTQRHDGSADVTLPLPSGSTWNPGNPTFWYGGAEVVFSGGGRLRYVPSDGMYTARALFTDAQDGCDGQASGATNGLLAFVRTGPDCSHTTTPAVWVFNGDTGAFRKVADDANQPSVSPDGATVAFTRMVDGHVQLFTVGTDGTGPAQLTTDAIDHNRPAWSPTGTRIAFDSAREGGGFEIRVLDVASGQSTAVGPSGSSLSDAAWQPLRNNNIGRVWGADAYGTNVASSRWTWNTVGQSVPGLMNAQSAVLISRTDVAYATTATSLAGKKRGPVLMTAKTGLDSAVATELKRMLPKNKTVYLIGGTKVLSGTVASKVTSLGYTVKRLSGDSRYATSVAVAKTIAGTPDYVFLATGTDYHSALAASSAAGAGGSATKAVVLLTEGSKMTSPVYKYLDKYSPRKTMVIPVGTSARQALLKAYDANRMPHWPDTFTYYPIEAGTNEATAAELADFWWYGLDTVGVAHVNSWQGGVSATSAMTTFGPLLWTGKDALSRDTGRWLQRESAGVNYAAVFGGTGSVANGTVDQIGAAMGITGRFTYTPYYNGAPPAATARTFSAGRDDVAEAPAAVRPDLSHPATEHRG